MHAIFSDQLLNPPGSFSRTLRCNAQRYIYASGSIGQSTETGRRVEGSIEPQIEEIFRKPRRPAASFRLFNHARRACRGQSDARGGICPHVEIDVVVATVVSR
jgi:hypothetical protein